MRTFGSEGLYLPDNLNYQLVNAPSAPVQVTDQDQVLNFVAEANGLRITKRYTFHPHAYTFDLQVSVQNLEDRPVQGRLNLALSSPLINQEEAQMYIFVGPVTYDGEELIEDKPKDLVDSPRIYQKKIHWSGYTSKYFLMAVSPGEQLDQLYIANQDDIVENRFISESMNLLPETSRTFSYSAYFGPVQAEYLSAAGNEFSEAINYGFFQPLAKPLMTVLKFFHSFTHNYGLAIILLTICIKILFWPLTQKSYKSMKGMQKLQPEMKRLREKYGSDKQKLNQEMMSFYKEHKVNPLGGCLPMIIQIPVFIALYRVLLDSIELRHAPFMLWITDLSAKDPYYVTPLIMGATMFLQQKMTPTNMDPTQEKIMLMMPVVFTFIFLNFPAGLVIYWLVNNLLTILQQYLIRRQPD